MRQRSDDRDQGHTPSKDQQSLSLRSPKDQKNNKDPLSNIQGPMTRAKSKRFKESLNVLIQTIFAKEEANGADLGACEVTLLEAVEAKAN